LLVGTVEKLTGVRVDHFAVIDFAGFRSVVDTFLTAPARGAGSQGGQSVVLLDDARAATLWAALRGGTPAAYAQQHPDAQLGPAPAGEEHP
jgi:hypothetical protein